MSIGSPPPSSPFTPTNAPSPEPDNKGSAAGSPFTPAAGNSGSVSREVSPKSTKPAEDAKTKSAFDFKPIPAETDEKAKKVAQHVINGITYTLIPSKPRRSATPQPPTAAGNPAANNGMRRVRSEPMGKDAQAQIRKESDSAAAGPLTGRTKIASTVTTVEQRTGKIRKPSSPSTSSAGSSGGTSSNPSTVQGSPTNPTGQEKEFTTTPTPPNSARPPFVADTPRADMDDPRKSLPPPVIPPGEDPRINFRDYIE